MKSTATTVADYLVEVSADRRTALVQLRTLCQQCLTGYEEVMDYGMPCYKKQGIVEVAFASQKNHIALYILKQSILDSFRPQLLDNAKMGKGCIRYATHGKIEFDVISSLLTAVAASTERAC